jgi:hypothetical protein
LRADPRCGRSPGNRAGRRCRDSRRPILSTRLWAFRATARAFPQLLVQRGAAAWSAVMLPITLGAEGTDMTLISRAREQLEAAQGLPGILDAAYAAFEDMLTVIEDREDPVQGLFITYATAGMIVANGRDAVLRAPSLPARRLNSAAGEEPHHGETAEDDARQLAALSTVIANRLSEVAGAAGELRDRIACEEAARSARNISALFTGAGP